MSDAIQIRGLRASGICGALPEEKLRRQPIEVDLDLEVDLSRPGASDDLADTIDYGAVCAAVERVITDEQFVLLERLAQRICDIVGELFGPVRNAPGEMAVVVSVRKLRPPVPQALDTSGITLRRTVG